MDKRMVAMLLAGGQGSRLKSLTDDIAKPAVPFGGKYRIIDFALSNASNSNIADIGILTQYKPFVLNSHMGIGTAWDYDRNEGGLRILSPFESEDGGRWYIGTANAIYENIDYLDDVDPEYVLVLSGDHIYKMDYNDLLDSHIEKGADVSIAVMEVPWDEAPRFGIINTGENQIIEEFDEKPENPKNNLASMGIYIFNWKLLREYLILDHNDPETNHDFGKNILPRMLNDGKKMFAWPFDGYWKDVGTVQSYWEANMDLLDEENTLDLFDKDWRIYTKSRNMPAQLITKTGKVKSSLVNEGCVVKGTVNHSILFPNVHVEEGAIIKNSVILSDTVIKRNAVVNNAVISEGMIVNEDQIVGAEDNHIYLMSHNGIEKE